MTKRSRTAWRNAIRRANRAWRRRLRAAEMRAIADTHVRPCPSCRSTQLCEPDCPVAPWNMDLDP